MSKHERRRTDTHLLGLLAALGATQAAAESTALLSIDRIFHDDEFELNDPVSSKWLADGIIYTKIEKSKSTPSGFDIVQHDSATGKEKPWSTPVDWFPTTPNRPSRSRTTHGRTTDDSC